MSQYWTVQIIDVQGNQIVQSCSFIYVPRTTVAGTCINKSSDKQ